MTDGPPHPEGQQQLPPYLNNATRSWPSLPQLYPNAQPQPQLSSMWDAPMQQQLQLFQQPQQDLGGSIANTIAYGGTNEGMFQTPSPPMSDFLGGTMYGGPDYGSILGNAYMPGLGALTGTGEARGNIYDPTGGQSNTIEGALTSQSGIYNPSAPDQRPPGTFSGRLDNLFGINPQSPVGIGGGFGSAPVGGGGYDGGLGQSGGFGGEGITGGSGGASFSPVGGIPGSPFGGFGGGQQPGQAGQAPGQGEQQPGGGQSYRRPQFGMGRWNDQAQMLAGNSPSNNMSANMPGYTGADSQAGAQRQFEQQRNTFPTAGQPMSSMAGPGMGELAQRALMGGQQPIGMRNPQESGGGKGGMGQVQPGGPGGMVAGQPPQIMQQPGGLPGLAGRQQTRYMQGADAGRFAGWQSQVSPEVYAASRERSLSGDVQLPSWFMSGQAYK